MASVVLVDPTGVEYTVTNARDFVDAVYGYGMKPKVGSISANYATLLPDGDPDPVIPTSPQFEAAIVDIERNPLPNKRFMVVLDANGDIDDLIIEDVA